jgi:CrcB protein
MNGGLLALVVGVAGGAGAALRLIVDSAIARRWPHELAFGTLAVNVVGSFIAGAIVGTFLAHGLSASAKTVVATGFCGGLTTWSAAMVETTRLFAARRWGLALGFGVGGFAASIGAAAIGLAIVGA